MPKIQILKLNVYVTHLLVLLDKMYKYEMDLTRTVDATERTRMYGRTEWNQYTPNGENRIILYDTHHHEAVKTTKALKQQ